MKADMTQQSTPAQRAFLSRFRPCAAGAAVTAVLSILCAPAGAQALAGAAAASLVAPGLGLPELARTTPAAPVAADAGTHNDVDGIDAATFRPDGPRAAGRSAASATAAPAPAAADAPAAALRRTGREAA